MEKGHGGEFDVQNWSTVEMCAEEVLVSLMSECIRTKLEAKILTKIQTRASR